MLKEENLNEMEREGFEEETLEESEVNEDKEFEDLKEDTIEEIEKDEEEEITNNLRNENQKLKDENKKMENELNALKDRLLRVNAEYDNFRKRTDKEKKTIYTDACADVLKEILPVFDSIEMAAKAEGNAEDIKKGIEITVKQFSEAFKKLNVEEISTDIEFDPNYHNAIMHVEDDNYEKNTIVEVFQRGFKREDKVLRFSLVKVAN